RHGEQLGAKYGGIDPFSSAWWFDGWADDGWRHGVPPPGPDTAGCAGEIVAGDGRLAAALADRRHRGTRRRPRSEPSGVAALPGENRARLFVAQRLPAAAAGPAQDAPVGERGEPAALVELDAVQPGGRGSELVGEIERDRVVALQLEQALAMRVGGQRGDER